MNAGVHVKSKEEIAAAYDSPPWWYDLRGFLILTFAYNSTLPRQMRFFGRHIGARHLEVACGTGTLLGFVLLWRRWKRLPAADICGIDYAEPMLAGARRRFAHVPGVQLRHADVAALPYQSASFDTVNIANAVHCFPDVDGGLRDVLRVLKPGGTLAANVLLYPRTIWPFDAIANALDRWGIRKGILFTPYTRDDIRRRIQVAGFELTFETISGNCYEIVARKPLAHTK